MEAAIAVKAAGWVVGKALGAVTGGLLEAWAASKGLGPNVDALKVELLYAQAMLENTQEREIHSPALKELLLRLQQLAYCADDVLDEIDYFRIQDELEGTYHAADAHAGGCVKDLFLNARHVAGAVAAKLKPSCGSCHTIRGEHDEQEGNAKHGCLSTVVSSCGRGIGKRSLFSSWLTFSVDDCAHFESCVRGYSNVTGNGNGFFCGKREMSSSPASPTNNQLEKKASCGCLLKVTPTACDTAKSIGKKCLPCFSFQSVDGDADSCMLESDADYNMSESDNSDILGKQKRFLYGAKETDEQAPKLKFNRVGISKKMGEITEHLKYVCAKVSNVLNLEFMGTRRITRKDLANKRPITTSDITETELYGRNTQKKTVVDGIINGKYFANNDELVVLPIVGPGGIGKTTFTQHVYAELKSHFEVTIWICVSLNFTASRLAQEAAKQIPRVNGEKENGSDQELIEQRLKSKRFLFVLDDMWACLEDEWDKLLAPFRRGGEKGSVIIVTTRIPEVANLVKKPVDCALEMGRLEAKDFMDFFEACIFGCQQPWEGPTALLRGVGEQIVNELKGFPLAAKTVGRLLRNQLTLDHWNRVLESKEWELQTNKNDIMPALKLSYDYLPFHLQQCFYYCALFPEDYEFDSKELVHLWIGLGIVQPLDLNSKIEDVGLCHLDDLVNHGFLKKNKRNDGSPCYVVHDLLHNLAGNISSFDCLSICSSNVKLIHIRQDIRHLSIIIDDKDVEDIRNFKYYNSDLTTLDKRLNVENLRTLMVFGQHQESFAKVFCDLFEKARALRVIYLSSVSSYTMEHMLHEFPNHIHLRYLRTKSANYTKDIDFNLSALTRLYHLEIIDIQECSGRYGSTRHMSNLLKLRHFLVSQDELQLHSNIVEVGKLKSLQELRRFEVGREPKGFELSQLGQLSELGGSLSIGSLERVREDVNEARLIQIKHLHKITLEWNANRPKKDNIYEQKVLETLMPPSDLKGLCIRGHGGTKCPPWLGENLSIKNLELLHLDDVAWNKFPPIGELLLNEPCEELLNNNFHGNKFQNLKKLELVRLPRLKNWTVKAPCHLFAQLEVLVIRDCCELMELSFSHYTCCPQQKEANMKWFPNLQKLKIKDCPKLLSFPPVPWTRTPCIAKIKRVGSGLEELVCKENYKSEYSLIIRMKDAPASELWNVLAFDNLTELKELWMDTCPPLPQHHFQMLSSLKTLYIFGGSSIVFQSVEDESYAEYQSLVECMIISQWDASAKELTQLLTYFPQLSELDVRSCNQITGLAVVEKQAAETPAPESSDNKMDDQQQDDTRGEEEIVASSAEGLLLLPSQLQTLRIEFCRKLILCSDSIDHNRGLQGLSVLRSLTIFLCPMFLSYSSCPPFPTSLEYLYLYKAVPVGTAMQLPLSNLASLTYLSILECKDLRGEGLRHLLAKGRLTTLNIKRTPNFFDGPEPPLPHEQEFPSTSSELKLWTDDDAGVFAAPICTFLSSSLTELSFEDKELERFKKEQEDALRLLTSLEEIKFLNCDKLQCLPAGLRGLPKLKRLIILYCPAIRSLPKDGLPSSLQELRIESCPAIQSLPKDCLLPTSLQKLRIWRCSAIRSLPKDGFPGSLQKLEIYDCPAIRSLPKVNDLPSSLRELHVRGSGNEELRRQCRKLIGIIPVVYI